MQAMDYCHVEFGHCKIFNDFMAVVDHFTCKSRRSRCSKFYQNKSCCSFGLDNFDVLWGANNWLYHFLHSKTSSVGIVPIVDFILGWLLIMLNFFFFDLCAVLCGHTMCIPWSYPLLFQTVRM